MCNAVDEYAEEEKPKLLIDMSEEFGLTKEGILEKLQEKHNISSSKAEEAWKENHNISEM